MFCERFLSLLFMFRMGMDCLIIVEVSNTWTLELDNQVSFITNEWKTCDLLNQIFSITFRWFDCRWTVLTYALLAMMYLLIVLRRGHSIFKRRKIKVCVCVCTYEGIKRLSPLIYPVSKADFPCSTSTYNRSLTFVYFSPSDGRFKVYRQNIWYFKMNQKFKNFKFQLYKLYLPCCKINSCRINMF